MLHLNQFINLCVWTCLFRHGGGATKKMEAPVWKRFRCVTAFFLSLGRSGEDCFSPKVIFTIHWGRKRKQKRLRITFLFSVFLFPCLHFFQKQTALFWYHGHIRTWKWKQQMNVPQKRKGWTILLFICFLFFCCFFRCFFLNFFLLFFFFVASTEKVLGEKKLVFLFFLCFSYLQVNYKMVSGYMKQ